MLTDDGTHSCLRCNRVKPLPKEETPAADPPLDRLQVLVIRDSSRVLSGESSRIQSAPAPSGGGGVSIPAMSYLIQPGVWMAECPFVGRIVKHGRTREEAMENLVRHVTEASISTEKFPGKEMEFFTLSIPVKR